MSEQKVSIFVDLNGNLTERAERFGRSMSRLSRDGRQSMQMLGTGIRQSSAAMDRWGNRAALAGAAAGYGFKRTLLTTAAQFEKFESILTTIEGSSDKAKASMAWVTDFAGKTPYELAQVTDAFVKLKAYGIDPQSGALASAGDAAAAMGKPLEQAVEALADAMTGENERLKEFGITSQTTGDTIVYRWQQNGKSMVATAKKNSKDQIQATIEGIWNSKYKGAMDKLSTTWDGMTSNLGDQWTVFQKDVMNSGAFDFLKNELKSLLTEIDRMKETGEYDQLVQTVGTNLVEGFKSAKEAAIAIKDVATDLKPLVESIGKAMQFLDAKVGYANLAKTLAALYLINKAMRLGGAPLAQAAWKGASYTYGKVRGKGAPDVPGIGGAGGPGIGGGRGLGGFGGAVPVYLVDGPMSTIGDRKTPTDDPHGKKKPSRTQPTKAGRLARIGENLAQGVKGMGGGIKAAASGIRPGDMVKAGAAGAALNAVMLAPVLLSDASVDQKVHATGEAVGGGLGGWGGAAMGAAIGTAILPGIGTAIGGLLGGIAGAWVGSEAGSAAADKVNTALDLTVKIESADGSKGQVTGMKSTGELNADVYNGRGMT